jgi:hypothetical protein
MKNTIIALAMTASILFVGSPAQADDVPTDPSGNPTTSECGQAYDDARLTYGELQWQIELNQRAELKIEKQKATIQELRKQIRQLKHRLNK